MDRARRTVVEVRDDLHREIRKLALLNDLRIYELTNAIIEECLTDQERIKAVIKNLILQNTHTLKPVVEMMPQS